MRIATAIALLVTGLVCCGCSEQPGADVTGSTEICAARLYTPYNAKDLKQCVDVCIQCNRGVMTTCSTSCKLKGAS